MGMRCFCAQEQKQVDKCFVFFRYKINAGGMENESQSMKTSRDET